MCASRPLTGRQLLEQFGHRVIVRLPGGRKLVVRANLNRPVEEAVLPVCLDRSLSPDHYCVKRVQTSGLLNPCLSFNTQDVTELELQECLPFQSNLAYLRTRYRELRANSISNGSATSVRTDGVLNGFGSHPDRLIRPPAYRVLKSNREKTRADLINSLDRKNAPIVHNSMVHNGISACSSLQPRRKGPAPPPPLPPWPSTISRSPFHINSASTQTACEIEDMSSLSKESSESESIHSVSTPVYITNGILIHKHPKVKRLADFYDHLDSPNTGFGYRCAELPPLPTNVLSASNIERSRISEAQVTLRKWNSSGCLAQSNVPYKPSRNHFESSAVGTGTTQRSAAEMRRSWFPMMNLGENPGRDYNGCRPRSFCPGMESSCHNGYNTDEDGLTASDVKRFSSPSKSIFSNSGASNERNSLQLSSSKSQAAMALSSVVPSPYTNEKSVLGNSNSLSDLSQYGEFSDPTDDSRRVKIPGLTMDTVKKFTQQKLQNRKQLLHAYAQPLDFDIDWTHDRSQTLPPLRNEGDRTTMACNGISEDDSCTIESRFNTCPIRLRKCPSGTPQSNKECSTKQSSTKILSSQPDLDGSLNLVSTKSKTDIIRELNDIFSTQSARSSLVLSTEQPVAPKPICQANSMIIAESNLTPSQLKISPSTAPRPQKNQSTEHSVGRHSAPSTVVHSPQAALHSDHPSTEHQPPANFVEELNRLFSKTPESPVFKRNGLRVLQ